MKHSGPPGEQHYEGVFPSARKNGQIYYRASLTYRRKHISLGSYKDPERAHHAYLEGLRLLNARRTVLEDYTEDSPLPFGFWRTVA